MPKKRRSLEERFWEKVDKSPKHKGCWKWTSAFTYDPKSKKQKYGAFWVDSKRRSVGAHKISYIICHGWIPDGKHILHRCNNMWCVNPDHLYAGTHQDNMRDKERSGMMPVGDKNPAAKLNIHQARIIKRLHGKLMKKEIANIFNTTTHSVKNIHVGRTWTHVCQQS